MEEVKEEKLDQDWRRTRRKVRGSRRGRRGQKEDKEDSKGPGEEDYDTWRTRRKNWIKTGKGQGRQLVNHGRGQGGQEEDNKDSQGLRKKDRGNWTRKKRAARDPGKRTRLCKSGHTDQTHHI